MKNCKLTTRHKFIQWGATLVWALLNSLHAALHFDDRFLEGLNLWHGSKSSGLFVLRVIIELSELRRSESERKSVLFFLIEENTRSSPALLCGIVKTPNATFFLLQTSPYHVHAVIRHCLSVVVIQLFLNFWFFSDMRWNICFTHGLIDKEFLL